MAKETEIDDFELDESQEEGKGNKIVNILIGIIIFIFLLGGVALAIKLDVGGIGTNVLRNYLKNIPVINKVLPDISADQEALENGYEFDNLTDAMNYIKELEAKIKTLESSNSDGETSIADLEAEIERLKVFEDEQDAFNERVLEFDTEVVFNDKAPDISEYQKFYEGINAENAAEIYRQVLEQLEASEIVKEQAERYSKMDAGSAASALEVMTGDLDLVADILTNMSTAKAAAIMDEMDADFCAKITKKMSLLESTTTSEDTTTTE